MDQRAASMMLATMAENEFIATKALTPLQVVAKLMTLYQYGRHTKNESPSTCPWNSARTEGAEA